MSTQTSENGFTLKHLKHDDYHEMFDERVSVKRREEDHIGRCAPVFSLDSCGIPDWMSGQPAQLPDGSVGIISGFAVENGQPQPFARVNGRLYHLSVLRRA